MRNDDTLLSKLQEEGKPIEIGCLSSLLKGNHFKSANFAVDTIDESQIDAAINAAREASSYVQQQYQVMLDKIEEEKSTPVRVVPPFTWY